MDAICSIDEDGRVSVNPEATRAHLESALRQVLEDPRVQRALKHDTVEVIGVDLIPNPDKLGRN